MGGILIFFLLIVVFVILFIFSAGISILRGIFNFLSGNKSQASSQQSKKGAFFEEDRESDEHQGKGSGEKVFSKDEGEYVDFVEIKDEEPKK